MSSLGDFGKLPPELRDTIYDLCCEETQSEGIIRKWNFSGHTSYTDIVARSPSIAFKVRTTLPHLRLVSRTVKLEYDRRVPTANLLSVFLQGGSFPQVAWRSELLLPTKKPTDIEITLAPHQLVDRSTFFVHILDTIPEVTKWVRGLCYGCRIRTFGIRLVFTGDFRHFFTEFSLAYRRRLRACLRDALENFGLRDPLAKSRPRPTSISMLWSADGTGEPTEFARWTPKSGLKSNEEGIAICVAVMARKY